MMSASHVVSTIALSAAAGFAASFLIVLTQDWHGRLSLDKDVAGVQKFHETPVPRIGGIALLLGVLAAFASGMHDYTVGQDVDDLLLLKLVIASSPAFLAGVTEDMTKRVSVKARLTATIASALLAAWLLDAYLPRLDIWGVDALLDVAPLLAVVITAVAVAGVANSINIIDGFHGVAGSAVVILLAGLGFLAWQADDIFVTNLALIGIGATLGFLAINYPKGRIFMGDGGAYFLGFWVAEVAVLLVIRNPGIGTWQVLAICGYPVIEVLYSMYRRKVIRKVSPGMPDRLHLHTLIYRRLVYRLLPRNERRPWLRNAAVAWVVAGWNTVTTVAAVTLGDTTLAALAVLFANVVLYVAVYGRLARGRWTRNRAATASAFRSRAVVREMQ